jgi:hypothetical protein
VGELAIDENFPEGVPVFDVFVVEAGEQISKRFLSAAEAGGFAREAVEPDERGVVAGPALRPRIQFVSKTIFCCVMSLKS